LHRGADHIWLDGVWDALCISPTRDYRPSLRSPWPAAIGSDPQVVDGARQGMHLNRAATIRGGWTDLTMLEEPTTHGISQASCLAVRRCIRISVSTLSPGDPDARETPINSVVGHERA
jgi:hypothetical protein